MYPPHGLPTASLQPVSTYLQQSGTTGGVGENVAPAPPQPNQQPEETEHVTLLPGTVIFVRIADKVDSSKAHASDLLTGIVDPSVIYNSHVLLIPRGTEAHVRMVEE